MTGKHGRSTGRPVGDDLVGRLDSHLRAADLLTPASAITVALSGGLDSVVLLDLLLRLRDRWEWAVSAAHFDHRMREESATDALWVKELCESRGVPCRVGSASSTPSNESEARELRYKFLHSARASLGAHCLVTAHQADDQAETVLFRLLRGSGLAGLAGIPARRAPGVVRPLLPFWRSELEVYGCARGLSYLDDPSNLDLTIARNRIRHRLIPEYEATGAPEFRRDLYRLSELAGRADAVVTELTDKAVDGLIMEAAEARIVVARTELLAYDTGARAHLLRALVARVGPRPGRIGTRIALKFVDSSSSGRAVDLAGGVVMRREFDRLIIERLAADAEALDEELVIGGPGCSAGLAVIGGARWEVCWKLGAADDGQTANARVARFDLVELDFPLTVRSRRPGDRVRLAAGTRKLKRVFMERKIGRSERNSYPVLLDRSGVLWVAALVRSARAQAREGREVFSVWLRQVG
ncbi:MAG: tRNA lysidine(34) synthetase TilS [Gemmatimonadota bacterium]|nr:MAG: tRNA lysidine(34) synthetase TilS [Gemmatimonadota bacterium]